ncbi:sugar phosphate isomerase/epimerase family protein [Bythopirellula polymerisocia]|uniref:Fructoselysine 3-epimerase n=1 Tax=Bythopirellula polymerisocia TaxID=2528003 RepID=A0A5C6C1V0_9BACT|nr:sugar phosphate isomerase/epimerase family protein [Bythopirellula polymerisocia]TWU17611.1 fructoselysine 3-epimerase [Bythopirellula polymerisocia]
MPLRFGNSDSSFDRRHFLKNSASCAVAFSLLPALASKNIAADQSDLLPPARKLFTAVKWGMIEIEGSVTEKFQLCKDLGYSGMELVSPLEGFTIDDVSAARRATGMPVHGVVDMKHWNIRLSSPQEEVRAQAVGHLEQALLDCHALGGFSVLLVPGKVTGPEETHEDVWKRSIQGIRKVLPSASQLGVRVLIENVWNGFCETPEQMRDYIDEIDNPWVGSYFDIGNVRKFGPSEDWIRTLGNRIVKLDVKDWSQKDGFCKIGDGDVDWPEVRRSLAEIEFSGWCTAEVTGGDSESLRDIHRRMTEVLEID